MREGPERGSSAARPQAYLVDVYETVLTCDFTAHATELPALAGVSLEAYREAMGIMNDPLTDGRCSMAEAMAEILASDGRDPDPGFVAQLVRRDQELLIERARLFDDAVPFLEQVRSYGIAIALVSNCAENTGPLLDAIGLSALADAIVLSCDVGHAKPAVGIYRCALEQLGVDAEASVFVDDQAAYCAGAVASGMRAVQVVREHPRLPPELPGTMRVRSLSEIPELFEPSSASS